MTRPVLKMQLISWNGLNRMVDCATYCIFGTDLAAGHHNEQFDINEDTLHAAVDVLFRSVLKINAYVNGNN